MRRLILRSFQSPGDVVMLTAAVRDLHAACPGQFLTDVRTSADGLWLHNPHITRLEERESGVHVLDMHYPLIHQSNQRPYHFLHGYPQFLEEQLGVRVPVTRFHGDVYLAEDEKRQPLPAEWGLPEQYWIVVAGGNHQFLSTNGALSCCLHGGCWKSRCQLVGDGDRKDGNELCEQPVQIAPDLRIPRCMHMITPADVIRRIELYYEGGALSHARDVAESLRDSSPVSERPIHVKTPLVPSAISMLPASQLEQVPNVPSTRRTLLSVPEPRPSPGRSVLLRFRHGLGDAVQLTVVLKHLRQHRPDLDVDVAALVGKHQGNTSGDRKDLPHDLVRDVCEVVLNCGAVPVILDWDRRSPLVDGKTIHNPGAEHELWHGQGTGDAESLAALIDASRLLIGVDSGPLHVAGATSTPTIGVWTQHHPVHFFDLADNVLHLLPGDHEKLAAGPQALEYFRGAYHWQAYKQLSVDLPALVHSRLTGEEFEVVANKRFLKSLTAHGFDRRYYEEHKIAGLDYLGFGDWQRQYGRWLVESLDLKGKRVLDVGCACGAILRGLGEAGAIVHGVDINEHMIELGREQWPDMAPLLFTCDAVNLHLYADASWDAVHTAQVAEHWKPHLVPHILD